MPRVSHDDHPEFDTDDDIVRHMIDQHGSTREEEESMWLTTPKERHDGLHYEGPASRHIHERLNP